MDFFLFVVVTAIVFIRPTDFVPGLEQVPLYLIAIVLCIILSWNKLVPFISGAALREQPVLVLGIGVLSMLTVSTITHGLFEKGFTPVVEVSKILVFYLLLQAQLNSPSRLARYLGIVACIIIIPVALAVLNYHAVVHIEAFHTTRETNDSGRNVPAEEVGKQIERLGTTGNFADPNDVCEIVNCAIIFSLYGLLEQGGCLRILWLGPLALFGHALALTQSRGGFLGLAVGLMVLFRSRFGTKKSLVAAGLALPVVVVFFAGRQTSIDVSEGTGQQRIQLWDDAFNAMRGSPLFGLGWGEFTRLARHAGHNALIHVCAELGLVAGVFFVGQYYYCLKNLTDLGAAGTTVPNLQMRRMQPFILASVASFATSEMSITNPVSLITYVIFGVATTFIRLADRRPPLPDLVLSGSLLRRAILCCGLLLVALYVFVKFNVRYG